MEKRRVIIQVSDENGEWGEEYVEGKSGSFTEADVDLEKWANDMIDGFNATLRFNESKRKLESVVVDTVDDEQDLSEDLEDEDDLDEDEDDEDNADDYSDEYDDELKENDEDDE